MTKITIVDYPQRRPTYDDEGNPTCPIYLDGYDLGYIEGTTRKNTATCRFKAGEIYDWEIEYAVEVQIHGVKYALDGADGLLDIRYLLGYIQGTYVASGRR